MLNRVFREIAMVACVSAVVFASNASAQTLDKNRTALVFVEFQEEWIGDDATLRKKFVKDEEGMERATVTAGRVLEAARSAGWNVVHAPLDLGDDSNYLIFGGGRDKFGLRGAIPRLQTWQESGSRFVEPFVPRENEFVIRGRSGASVLTNSTLDAYLRNNGIDTLVLMGFATHVCIESTLRQGHDMGYNVYVVNDAVAAFEPEQQAHFAKHVLHHFGEGIESEELVKLMR